LKIREATDEDKIAWDTFVDTIGGNFGLYFDWKYFYELQGGRYIPLITEDDSSQIIGILPLVKRKNFLHSTLESLPEGGGGVLLKKELSESEKYEATRALIEQVDQYHSQGCSGLSIRKSVLWNSVCTDLVDSRDTMPEKAMVDSGLTYKYNETTGFPCTHVMELKQPFEEYIWKGMWPGRLRNLINKAVRNGINVIEDQEFKYKDIFTDMLTKNYRRHGNKRNIKDETRFRFEIFKDKTKLFIALRDGQPVAGELCHYTVDTCKLAKLGSYARETGHASKLCVKAAIEDACNAGYRFVESGISTTPDVADFKLQFKFVTLPFGTYQKTYSVLRNRVHQTSQLFEVLRNDKTYIWKNRRKLWNRITRG